MIPNLGVASERASRTPERVDAVVLGGRGRIIVIASAGGQLAGAHTRNLVRAASEQLELALRDGEAEGAALLEQLRAAFDAAARNHAEAVWRELALLVACVSERQVVLFATAGMRCYRFRDQALAEITAGDHGPKAAAYVDDVVAGDAYVLCTEGVHDAVSGERMLGALRADFHPRDVAWAIVEVARAAGLEADLTAVVVRPLDRRAKVRELPHPPQHPATRFGAERLARYREHLEALLAEIRGMQERFAETNPAGFSAGRLAVREIEVEEALARMDAGVFGRCVRCAAEIQKDRLEARTDEPRCRGCAR